MPPPSPPHPSIHTQIERDVFSGGGGLLGAALSGGERGGPQAVATAGNGSLVDEGRPSDKQVSFVGRKGPEGQAGAPLRVGLPARVQLNDLPCAPLGGGSREGAAEADASAGALPGGSGVAPTPGELVAGNATGAGPAAARLAVATMPISYADGADGEAGSLFAASFTQLFLNVSLAAADGRAGAVPLDSVVLRYWFHGGSGAEAADGGVQAPGADAGALFKLFCSDLTAAVGCGRLRWSFNVGLPLTPGARYVLTLGFAPGSGFLVEPGAAEAAPPPPDGAAGAAAVAAAAAAAPRVPAVEAILSLEPRRYFAQLNASADYSYLSTPLAPQRAPGGGNGSEAGGDAQASRVILRQVAPNPRLPAYVSGRLAWGTPPMPSPADVEAASAAPASTPPPPPPPKAAEAVCEDNPQQPGAKLCGVSAVYCCAGAEPLSGALPADWRGRAAALAAAADAGDGASPLGRPAGGRPGVPIIAIALPIALTIAACAGGAAAFALTSRRRRQRASAAEFAAAQQQRRRPPAGGDSRLVPMLRTEERISALLSSAEFSASTTSASLRPSAGGGRATWRGGRARRGADDERVPLLPLAAIKYATMPNLHGGADGGAGSRRRSAAGSSVAAPPPASPPAAAPPSAARLRRAHSWAGRMSCVEAPFSPVAGPGLTELLERRRTVAHPLGAAAAAAAATQLPRLRPRDGAGGAAAGRGSSSGGGSALELSVDFEAEIEPHLGALLGRGGFGRVLEGRWRGRPVAVKLLEVESAETYDAVVKARTRERQRKREGGDLRPAAAGAATGVLRLAATATAPHAALLPSRSPRCLAGGGALGAPSRLCQHSAHAGRVPGARPRPPCGAHHGALRRRLAARPHLLAQPAPTVRGANAAARSAICRRRCRRRHCCHRHRCPGVRAACLPPSACCCVLSPAAFAQWGIPSQRFTSLSSPHDQPHEPNPPAPTARCCASGATSARAWPACTPPASCTAT